MTPPDLDARVAEAEAAWELADAQCRMLNVDEQIALMGTLRDLHAALQAREGGEFEAWGVCDPEDGSWFVTTHKPDAESCCRSFAMNRSPGIQAPVRRLRCRVVEGE